MDTKIDEEIKQEINVFAAFKKHLFVFVLLIILFWLGWLVTGGQLSLYAWPTYASLAWGFVLVIHLLIAYSSFRKTKKKPRW
jgi:hypothetical protein